MVQKTSYINGSQIPRYDNYNAVKEVSSEFLYSYGGGHPRTSLKKVLSTVETYDIQIGFSNLKSADQQLNTTRRVRGLYTFNTMGSFGAYWPNLNMHIDNKRFSEREVVKTFWFLLACHKYLNIVEVPKNYNPDNWFAVHVDGPKQTENVEPMNFFANSVVQLMKI